MMRTRYGRGTMTSDEQSGPKAETDPYESSPSEMSGTSSFGQACPKCQSFKTRGDGELASKPGVFKTIFFGLYYLLIRGAFARKAIHCDDCGETSYYKTAGSKIAMVILAILVTLIMAAYFGS